jgi:HNH endonuclease
MKNSPPPPKLSTPKSRDIQFAFDVGHSSIGWAVLDEEDLLGCGTVIFPKDDCLASQRRDFRRQRRHIRATRLRIARLKKLFVHLDLLSATALDNVSSSSPWFLAASVLASGGKKHLTWPELWDVLRWYAHNRGYDGNRAWSRQETDAQADTEDAEKVQNALALYTKYGTNTMAETWCRISGLDPLGDKTSCALPGADRPKGKNAAFPREDVEREVAAILETHRGRLKGCDEGFIQTLLHDHRALEVSSINLPLRYRGGLLFGQLAPRFENRIISLCPITFERIYQRVLTETGDEEKAKHEAEREAKVPSTNCREFFYFRWLMQLANVQIGTDSGLRRLTASERQALHEQALARGAFTKGEFKKAVRVLTGGVSDNLEQMFSHPDADRALVVDPVQRLLISDEVAPWFGLLPEQYQKRLRGRLRQGHRVTIGAVRDWLSGETAAFDQAISTWIDSRNTKGKKSAKQLKPDDVLAKSLQVAPPTGRAAHSRELMSEVAEFILSTNLHPAEKDGPLHRSEAIRAAQLQRSIDEKTNNHLVRHRLEILDRLHADLVKHYATDDKSRVTQLTIEVNRDLRTFSGMTAKEIAQDTGLRLGNFKKVAAKLEEALVGKNIPVNPGLIRKARIAEDLGWTCPYTGKSYDAFDLVNRRVDKDHIIPRSDRPSDSLDSLIITFNEINRWKGRRTAYRFIEEEQGKLVPGLPHLFIKPLAIYLADAQKLESFKGHDDDVRRKRNRKRLLVLPDYVDKEFVPRDLTQTSQLVRLGAELLGKAYQGEAKPPVLTSLPGSVTGVVRKNWNVLGCLAVANPLVTDPTDLDEAGHPHLRTKTEIRDITHLHHALDACVLVLASRFLPPDGAGWELLVKRRLNADEQTRARRIFKDYVRFDQDGTLRLIHLPNKIKRQIGERLAERRVVQHIPKNMTGLRAEQNAWRVVQVEDGVATLRQRMRQSDGLKISKERKERVDKLVGLQPGKLSKLKAVLVVADNYGLALDPEPTILPFHKVWNRLRELKTKNGGKPVRVLRNGMLIKLGKGKRAGIWRIFSIKNAGVGILLDLGKPDVVRLQNKPEGHWINASFTALVRDDMELLPCEFIGD